MLCTTTGTIAGKEITQTLGPVSGNVVQSKHIGRDIMAGLKTIVGGELSGYNELLSEARNIAVQRMLSSAKEKGADAVVGIRFATSAIMGGSSEILVFGTAVKLDT